MSELTVEPGRGGARTRELVAAGIGRRYRAERRFRIFGLVAIASALVFMALLFASIIGKGYTAFVQTEIRLPISYDVSVIDPAGVRDAAEMRRANYGKLYRDGIQALFPEVESRQDRRLLNGLVSSGATFEIRDAVVESPGLIGLECGVRGELPSFPGHPAP